MGTSDLKMKKALHTRNSKSFTKWDRAKEDNIPTTDLRNPAREYSVRNRKRGREREAGVGL